MNLNVISEVSFSNIRFLEKLASFYIKSVISSHVVVHKLLINDRKEEKTDSR